MIKNILNKLENLGIDILKLLDTIVDITLFIILVTIVIRYTILL